MNTNSIEEENRLKVDISNNTFVWRATTIRIRRWQQHLQKWRELMVMAVVMMMMLNKLFVKFKSENSMANGLLCAGRTS